MFESVINVNLCHAEDVGGKVLKHEYEINVQVAAIKMNGPRWPVKSLFNVSNVRNS